MVENKRGKKEKKSVGTCVEEKKRGEKKEKKEGEPTCVERKKEREKKRKGYHNIFTINLKVGYY